MTRRTDATPLERLVSALAGWCLDNKLIVFLGASLALIVASGIGVLAGSFVSNYISEKYLSIIAGIGFVVIGIFTIFRA